MPYYTGTANSASDLRQAIVNAGTANGWTWDASNLMLYKGDIYAKLTVSGNNVFVQTALGYSGGTLITPAGSATGIYTYPTSTQDNGNSLLQYPVTYRIFVHFNPDDIICSVNYQTTFWQWLAFGQAKNFGVAGKCTWSWGTVPSNIPDPRYAIAMHITPEQWATAGSAAGPFWRSSATYGTYPNSFIHLNEDGFHWWNNYQAINAANPPPPSLAVLSDYAIPIIAMQPNAWSGETVLARSIISYPRASGFYSYAAEIPSIRICRNDYLNDGQILTVGSDKWMVIPAYRKNIASRDGTIGLFTGWHTGTIGIAISYDGP